MTTGGYPNASFLINRTIGDSNSDRPDSAKVSIVSSVGYKMNSVLDENGIPSEQGILLNVTIMVSVFRSGPVRFWTGILGNR